MDVAYTTIHGRRYAGDYYIPNDEEEQTRQQMLHGVYLHLLGNELTTVRLQNPEKILDIGTGTGEWAIAMADEFPDAEVTGTDIAKIQPSAVPHNIFFEIDDAEIEGGWTWTENEFDLVHFRSMAGAFRDWNHIYREVFRVLKPGGWIEVIDFDNHSALLKYFGSDSAVFPFLDALNSAMKESGRWRSGEHLQPELLRNAGFSNASVIEKKIPMGIWPEDKKEKEIGKHFLVAQLCGIEALCIRPLTERGWDIEEIRRICSEVTEDVRNVGLDPEKGRGLGAKVRILTARKPCGLELDVPDGGSTMGDSIRTVTQTNGEAGVNGGA
jgi:SAM-dependent methyltransferase